VLEAESKYNVLLVYLLFQFFRGLIMALKKGSNGDEVAAIQDSLKASGYYTGAIDGVFGSETETAVKNFQKSVGLKVDGVVGPETYEALQGDCC
jgi:peptidoglycan hydrolase-like protein with peptidoglycan-binding domain